ncbi:hypothetical protein GGR54DRAFT_585243 [Hypoxylon sp. NC1633]|nr:hypothetical protein GGR54DRAFT_585243 [Hypoxylon sp. NC1633]
MAAPKQDPLQVLEQMFNEVLVQTGRHLRSSARDGPRNIVGASSAISAKAAGSLSSYHYALDDLESEITRAKAVVLRDLEKLRAARAPAPAPAPVPVPQPMAPPAPMMELPSSAAHTMSAPALASKQEPKTAAPFPDMGMGISADIVDLTSSEKKPSPRVPSGVIRPPARGTPPVRNEVKPSPKQAPKSAPKTTLPPKVTPVPLPQIPRLQPPQPAHMALTAPAQPKQAAPNVQPNRTIQVTPAVQPAQNATMNAMHMPANAGGSNPNGAGGGNSLNFTDMQFSLAPSNSDTGGAPPAPMPEFDLTTFAPQDGGDGIMSLGKNPRPSNTASASGQSTTAAPPPPPPPQQQQQQQQHLEQGKTESNLDDLFSLDNNGGTDNMFDLGGGSVNDSTFDDMMYFDTNDADMGQFDEAFFLQ